MDVKGKHQRHLVAIVIAGTSLAMLGLAFAAVPLYRLFCATTGFAGTPQIARRPSDIKGQRVLTVRFDANVAPGLVWKFAPETSFLKLRTGETATVFYKVTNLSDQATEARAMFNVTPDGFGAYFDKIVCFCFSEQKLGPSESLELPVVFFLDPALEKDPNLAEVAEVTLSYTFFAAQPVARDRLTEQRAPL